MFFNLFPEKRAEKQTVREYVCVLWCLLILDSLAREKFFRVTWSNVMENVWCNFGATAVEEHGMV